MLSNAIEACDRSQLFSGKVTGLNYHGFVGYTSGLLGVLAYGAVTLLMKLVRSSVL